MLTEPRTIDILGTEIRVLFWEQKQDESLKECDGYFDSSENLIVVKIPEKNGMSLGNLENYQKKVLRHEVIHAFLYHSGMSHCSTHAESWATNEEMVDWFAIQAPKICKVFREQKLV